jgi:hypothetical protein
MLAIWGSHVLRFEMQHFYKKRRPKYSQLIGGRDREHAAGLAGNTDYLLGWSIRDRAD